MIRVLFGRAGARAVAVLVACVMGGGAVHAGWDDVACDPAPVHHDHNAHRLSAGTLPTGAPDHCLFCHSQRTLRNGRVATYASVFDSVRTATVRISSVILHGRSSDSATPSRAPPSIEIV